MRLTQRPFGFVIGAAASALALFCFGLFGPTASAQQPEPVENLQKLLKSQIIFEQPEAALAYRRKVLAEASEKLTTTTDLRLALALPEWEDTRAYAPQHRAVDQEARAAIGKRLADLIKGIAETGDSQNQMALANLVGEIGTGIRGVGLDDKSGYARTLAPSLIVLMQKDDPKVRQMAARALPKIFPEPGASATRSPRCFRARTSMIAARLPKPSRIW